jgi:hypothetical protein
MTIHASKKPNRRESYKCSPASNGQKKHQSHRFDQRPLRETPPESKGDLWLPTSCHDNQLNGRERTDEGLRRTPYVHRVRGSRNLYFSEKELPPNTLQPAREKLVLQTIPKIEIWTTIGGSVHGSHGLRRALS